MGLFDFKKKKEALPSPPHPVPVQQEQPAQPAEPKEEIDFDKLMSSIPPMPSEPLQPPMPAEGLPRSRQPLQPMNEPPIILQRPQRAQFQNPVQPQGELARASEPGFELPDFEEEEREEFLAVVFDKPKPLMKPVVMTEEVKIEEAQKPASERPMSYPEKPVTKTRQESFVDIETYMALKENMNGIRKLATTTENLIEQHAATIKATNDKYHELADSLNFLQEKIILIDTKLFETP